ncbi:MAG: selenoneine biosynthesis selenosugar synthase SenB [Caldimonas sp.]
MHRFQIVIVTPAGADANNGNWQTAHRWVQMLSKAYRVRLAPAWEDGDESLLIALHARRSAASVAAWRASAADRPLVLVLTGTDLYRDIDHDAAARRSLVDADRLVVLNELGARRLPAQARAKACIVLQSCSGRPTLAKTARHLRALLVGHLREEKDPRTAFAAARRLADRPDILIDHAGAALDRALGDEAVALAAALPGYRWLGPLPHQAARRRIQAAHVLVHPSRMEGGANVVIEAMRSGTPVLASRIDGNVGLLGADYGGYFPVGDSAALAAALRRLRDEPAALDALRAQCRARAPLFEPARERDSLLAVAAGVLGAALP